MIAIFLVSFCLLCLYAIVFFRYRGTWQRAGMFTSRLSAPDLPFISVVVPVRNGENFIPFLSASLLRQDYPLEKVEFIFVDDHSADRTSGMLSSLSARLPLIAGHPPGYRVFREEGRLICRGKGCTWKTHLNDRCRL